MKSKMADNIVTRAKAVYTYLIFLLSNLRSIWTNQPFLIQK